MSDPTSRKLPDVPLPRAVLLWQMTAAMAGIVVVLVLGMGWLIYQGQRKALLGLVYREGLLLAQGLGQSLDIRALDFPTRETFIEHLKVDYRELQIGAGGYFCVLDTDGRVVLHSQRPQRQGAIVFDRPVEDVDGVPRKLGDVLRGGRPFSGRYVDLEGREELLSVAPVTGFNLFVTIHQPYEIVTRQLETTRLHIFLSMLVAILAAPILSVALLQRIVGPYYHRQVMDREQEYLRQLDASETRYYELFGAASDATFVVDAGTHALLEANHAAARLIGTTPEELCRRRLDDLFPEPERAAVAGLLAEVAAGRECSDREGFSALSATGPCPVAVSIKLLRQLGRPVYLTLLRDTSEREQHRQQLIQREKLAALGTVISGVAHELNNPLGSILGLSELLSRQVTDPTASEDLRILIAEARRCRAIVQDLLAVVRREAGPLEVLTLTPVLEDAIASLSPSLAALGIEVRREFAPSVLPVRGHAAQLHRVFVNLLANARDAALAKGPPRSVALRVLDMAGDNPRVRIEVEDSGPGIPVENLTRIFDPFFTTKPVGQGTGLGLALVAAVVRDHGGAVTAGNAPGGGAVLRIELPTVGEATTPLPPGRAAAPAAAPWAARILVVEDEPAMAHVIRRALSEAGYEVESARDGESGLDCLRRRAFDLVLSDLHLPRISGAQLYETACDREPEYRRRFVFLTGDVLSEVSRALAGQGRTVLRKPFSTREVVDAVKAAVAAAGPIGKKLRV